MLTWYFDPTVAVQVGPSTCMSHAFAPGAITVASKALVLLFPAAEPKEPWAVPPTIGVHPVKEVPDPASKSPPVSRLVELVLPGATVNDFK